MRFTSLLPLLLAPVAACNSDDPLTGPCRSDVKYFSCDSNPISATTNPAGASGSVEGDISTCGFAPLPPYRLQTAEACAKLCPPELSACATIGLEQREVICVPPDDSGVPNFGPCTGRRPEGFESFERADFARLAELECASIAAFETLRAELVAFGAPDDLIQRASNAMEEERRHTKLMEALAGKRVAVNARPAGIRRSLAQLREKTQSKDVCARLSAQRALHGTRDANVQLACAMFSSKLRGMKQLTPIWLGLSTTGRWLACLKWINTTSAQQCTMRYARFGEIRPLYRRSSTLWTRIFGHVRSSKRVTISRDAAMIRA